MVDSINFSHVNFKGSTNLLEQFKARQAGMDIQTAPEAQPVTASASDVLANYNRVVVKPALNNTESFEETLLNTFNDLTPAQPKVFSKDFADSFTGEKVLNSEGIVDYYEEKTGDISKVYKIYDGKVNEAYEFDTKTGNMIRADFYDTDGNPMYIEEYEQDTGFSKKCTGFTKTGKIKWISESQNGEFLRFKMFDEETGLLKSIRKSEPGVDGGCYIEYKFENGKLARKITESKDGAVIETSKFFAGKEISTVSNKQYPVIDTSGVDLGSIDLKPSELGNVELDVTKVNGEKKMRSNNTLEKIVVMDGNIERTYQMNLTGTKLDKIIERENGIEKRTIYMDGERVYQIDDCNSEGVPTKSTRFYENGKVNAVMEEPLGGKNGELRSVFYYDDGKIKGYDITDDKTFDLKHTFRFDREGNLIEVGNYDENGKIIDWYYNNMINFVPNKTEEPDNAESVKTFKACLDDANWIKKYLPGNVVYIKQDGVIDGMEYEVFSNGTVRALDNCGYDAIIMNSNEELIKFFDDCKAKEAVK